MLSRPQVIIIIIIVKISGHFEINFFFKRKDVLNFTFKNFACLCSFESTNDELYTFLFLLTVIMKKELICYKLTSLFDNGSIKMVFGLLFHSEEREKPYVDTLVISHFRGPKS